MSVLRCKVLRLPANNQHIGSLFCVKVNGDLHNNVLLGVPHHLYFLSDGNLSKGEICYHSNINEIIIATEINCNNPDCKKIEACTDVTLGLPSIPEAFIRNYVDANGSISDVELNIQTWGGVLPDKPNGERWINSGGEACAYIMKRIELTSNNEVVINSYK